MALLMCGIVVRYIPPFPTQKKKTHKLYWPTNLVSYSKQKKAVSRAVAHEGGTLPWVTAVATIFHTDLCATGGSDGWVRFWKVSGGGVGFTEVGKVAVSGFVNGLAFAGHTVVVAVGQEPRLGRWARDSSVRNGIVVIPLPLQLGTQ